MEIMQFGRNLSTLVDMSESLKEVHKVQLCPGDQVLVHTRNSVYTIRTLGENWFEISGGWFDRKGKSPMKVRINGCTWGGSSIKMNIIAACGLCLEFGNRVVTTPIQKIVIFPSPYLN
jgi:hypothetical protein